MQEENNLQIIPRLVFILFIVILVFYSSSLSASYKKDEQVERIRKEAMEAERKIYLTGKFEPSTRQGFVLLAPEHIFGGGKMYLLKEAYEAFIQMHEAAKADGVDLKIASATRNFDYQKQLWDEKWAEVVIVDEGKAEQDIPDGLKRFRKVLEFNATPGTSRHHWGTDFDINRINPLYAGSIYDSIIREQTYAWLVKNAALFGFCQTYTKKGVERQTGYKEERWHWSYTPLAKILTEEYKNLIKNEDIVGFWGEEYAPSHDLLNNYVLGINPECL